MTPFGILAALAGLSHAEAASVCGVRIDTAKSWASGRRSAPLGALDELRGLISRQERAAAEAVAQIAEHDHSTLNRARMRLKRPPILSYNDVRIMIDRGALGLGEQLSETGGRALHHVRAFLRIQRGRVQLVRPHWRGNPRFGVIRHRYIALRAEDEPGSWQGGPLPGPHMIDELTDKSGGEQ